jgi:hypothetical protein
MANRNTQGFGLIPAGRLGGGPSIQGQGKYKGVIGVGGLVLARVPEEIAKQRQDYYAKQHEGQQEAVENDLMREQHKSMPINVDRQSRVTFGGTKKS